MHYVALDSQDEVVRGFILSLPLDPQGSVLELGGRAVAWVLPASSVPTDGEEPWTEVKNGRRCELIDRKCSGTLTPVETVELARLQEQMLRHRQRPAPLPLEDARCVHHELLAKAEHVRADP